MSLWIPITDIENITLRTNPDRIIHTAHIDIFSNNQTIRPSHSIEIKNNKASTLIIPASVENVSHIKIAITKATPNKRIWIVPFFAGFEYLLDECHIVKIKHRQKKPKTKRAQSGVFILPRAN